MIKTLNRKKTEVNYISIVSLRIMLSLIFVVASLNHLFNTEKTVARLEQAKFAAIGNLLGTPEAAVIISGIAMLIAGISLLVGFKTRFAALALILILIPITLSIQVGQLSTLGPLFKNIAILGGLSFFTLNNSIK